jgi:hypothetical protein
MNQNAFGKGWGIPRDYTWHIFVYVNNEYQKKETNKNTKRCVKIDDLTLQEYQEL